MGAPRRPERAASRFERMVSPEPNSGCWLWTGAVDGRGYGNFARNGRKSFVRAHRMSWMLYRGPIPDGMFVLHKCDVKACVNPDHLFIGTHTDNMQDHAAKGRHWVTVAPWRLRGEGNPNARLTAEEVAEIRNLHKTGMSVASLARRFGVGWSAVDDIIKGKNWIPA